MRKKNNKKNFNESFMDAYSNNYLSEVDLEPKAQIEVSPVYADAINKSKKIRERMKDEFEEQDELVDEFLETQKFVEKPKIKSTPQLKAMRLAENRASGNGKRKNAPEPFQLSNEYKKSSAINESVKKNLTEDYSNFIGKPLKDFLFYIYRSGQNNPRVNIEYENDFMGKSGYSGVVSDVPFYSADKIIKDVYLGDEKYYDFKVITESTMTEARTKGATGGINGYYYYVVAANENNEPVRDKDNKKMVKKVKGLDKLFNLIENVWTDEQLNKAGATQLYAYVEDPKNPTYFKVSNDDGTWDVLVDETEKDREPEEQRTLFNCVQADLEPGTSDDLNRLRKFPRTSKRDPMEKVAFDIEDIGFRDDVFYLTARKDGQIEFAKKVADAYGLKTSDVSEKGEMKFIRIYAPGAEKEMLDTERK